MDRRRDWGDDALPMTALDFQFVRGGLHLPALRLRLDPHERSGPEDLAFVSHAHADHTGRHARVAFTAPTQRLMRARVGGIRTEHVLAYGERRPLADLGGPPEPGAHLTLLPAGHVLGSAMSLLECGGESLLYTGDFKLQPGLSAERCRPVHADTLIMETTFGRPQYVLPTRESVLAGLVDFCRRTLAEKAVPVLLGYSLGKAQELLAGLGGSGLPVMLAEPAAKLARIYADFGVTFPTWRPLKVSAAEGHVVIAPPGPATARLREQLPGCRFAVATGWALDASCRYRYRADAAFALSDHADFPELVDFVRQVAPRRVFTLHGFAADFATHLRGLGFDAQPLVEAPQLELELAYRLGRND